MSSLGKIIILVALMLGSLPALAQDRLTALARVVEGDIALVDTSDGASLSMQLSQPVPWRVFLLDNPRRLVVDFSEVDWLSSEISNTSGVVADARTGVLRPGWSRLVADLAEPMVLSAAQMATGLENGQARLEISLVPTSSEAFAETAGAPPSALFRDLDPEVKVAAPADRANRTKPLIVLDPGHGGIDPGAQAGGLREADLMLRFALELQEALIRSGRFDALLTRHADEFVSLEGRLTIARLAGADVFLSLHADALEAGSGSASGATIHTLSAEASDAASQALAERHRRDDLLAGVDLEQAGDEIALILMDMARQETAPRSERLGNAIVESFGNADIKLNGRPRRSAAFSVLKSPEIPSVLIEIGFLSSARDRGRIIDQAWRDTAAAAIVDALLNWANEDAALKQVLRQ